MDALPSIEPMRRGRPIRAQAAPTPPPPAANVVPEVSQVSSKTPPAADFGSGFDDSFGQFAPVDPSAQFSKIGALDPSAQFSKISPTGDLFDFESSFKPSTISDSDKDAKKILSNSSTGFGQFSTPLAVDGFDLLKRQQMEQLDRFAVKPLAAPIGVPTSQGKAKVLDPSKTLDGLRSMDSGSRTGSSSGSGGNGYVSTPPLAAINTNAPPSLATRPKLVSQVSSSSNYRVVTPELPPMDRKELAHRDMEAELKLIQLQQMAFEQQQQQLLTLQRTQLEEQQRLHREQQEKLQKQQQQQIQQQHEKWQERKRMLKEQGLLSQKQLSQQQDLVQQHQSQQKLQQRQQQSVQLPSSPSSSPNQLPAISNLAVSMASVSLGNTTGNVQQNPYVWSVSGSSVQQSTGMVYPMASGSSTHSADPLASLTSQYMSQSRPSLDNLRANFSGQSSSIASSPAASFNSFTSPSANTSDSGATPLLPSAPIKSARRAVDSGASAANSNSSSSSQPSASPVAASAAARTRHRASIPPPGQKPELLPKPTRFRMKDGIASLAAGEEEAFMRKFPSADIDDEILSLTLTGNAASPLSSSSLPRENGVSGRDSPAPATSFSNSNSNSDINSNSHYRLQQGRESPTFDAGVKTVNGNGHSMPTSTDYRTPSQRARDLRSAQFGLNGSGREDDDDVEEEEEEEEEKLVRRPRPSANSTSTSRRPLDQLSQKQSASPSVEDSSRSRTTTNGSSPIKSATRPSQTQASTRQDNNASAGVDDSGPAESVRERIQRMNRIGRVA